jgi:hypothetical protein
MSKAIKLYPPEWRRRYGTELEEAAAASPGWRTEIDLIRGAFDAWTRSPGGDQMKQRLTKLAATLMVLPLLFLGMNLTNELRGSNGLLLESFFRSRFGEWVVVLGPFAAVALVLRPAVKIGADRQNRGPALSISLRLERFQLLVLALAALTALAFLGYGFVENYAPRTG